MNESHKKTMMWSIELQTSKNTLPVFLKVDPSTIQLEDRFTTDVSEVGHFGTGDLKVTLQNRGDLERAKEEMRLAGFPNGIEEPVTVWVRGEGDVRLAQLFQQELKLAFSSPQCHGCHHGEMPAQ